jgi:hypothetical protein
MQTQTLSLDSSDDTHSDSPEFFTTVVQPFVRKPTNALSALSYAELSAYREGCFNQFCKASTAADRDHWLHAMADAIVQQGVIA